MKPYQQEMIKCPFCKYENEVFPEPYDTLYLSEDTARISFRCGKCNHRWEIAFIATNVLLGRNKKDLTVGTGVELIAAERHQQIEVEGFTDEHDKQHSKEELVKAAICYALPAKLRKYAGIFHSLWPFSREWWKPTPQNRIKELVKAGALIAAEIDRLLTKARQVKTR